MWVHPVGYYESNRALAAYPHCGFTIHTEASNTDFRWAVNQRPVLHHGTCGHPSRTHSVRSGVKAARLLQAAFPTFGDVHGPLLRPVRPGPG